MRPRLTTITLGAGVGALMSLMARGRLTLDLRWGRTYHPVGPIRVHVAAPRELVYEQLTTPYLGRTPRAAREHLEVVERGEDMVLASHRSTVRGLGLEYTSETLEVLTFHPPERIGFRHVRGPVPYAVEEFVLHEDGDATELEYHGELGLDLWTLGAYAARAWVVPEWERIVQSSLAEVRSAAESRAAARARREARASEA